MNDDRVPMIQLPSDNAKRAGETVTCYEEGHREASLWSRCSPVAVIVISTILSTVPAVLTWKNTRYTSPQFYVWTTQQRATVQVVVNVLASVLGLLWTWAVCACFNMAMRSFLSGKSFPLNTLRYYVSISKRTLDWNLPPRLAFLSFIFGTLGVLPTWLWTGSLTPRASVTTILAPMFMGKTGPGSCPFLQAYDPRAAISEFCDETYQLNGTFSKCPSRQKSGQFVESLASANVAAGRTRNHPKLDNSGYMYENRSYGIGAAVGLQSLPDAGHTEFYDFSETGYLVDTICALNGSSDFTLSGPIMETHNEPGVPRLFWAQGRRPNNDWKADPKTAPGFYPMPGWGPAPDTVVAWSVGSCCNTNDGTPPFILSIAAGKSYAALDKLQCQIYFQPTLFDDRVSVSNRTIHVEPQRNIVVSDPEPRGMLREWTLRDLQSLPEVQSSLYVSTIGEALRANAINYMSITTLDLSGPQHVGIILAIETSLAAVIDDILLSLAGFALTQPGSWDNDSNVKFAISSVRLGSWRYAFPLLAINILASIAIVLIATHLRMFAKSSAFDFTDLFAMAAAASNGTDTRDMATGNASLTQWNGDPTARMLTSTRLHVNQGLELSRPIAIHFRTGARHSTNLS
jgi:hypothetical protein